MTFIDKQNKVKIELYTDYLKSIGSLSKLFSDSDTPLLHYRVVENIFCKVFEAENLAREDVAYDAKKDSLGIGIKTFTFESNTKSEKVAEFNRFAPTLRKLKGVELLLKIAELRNERIEFANRNYNIQDSIYHCVGRREGQLRVFEVGYDVINIDKLANLKTNDTSVTFNDDRHEYSFLFSKSTLFRKFYQPNKYLEINVDVIDEPFDVLLRITQKLNIAQTIEQIGVDYVILPLYSLRESSPNQKKVAEKSGLNQWNAGGRKRDIGEVYIPIPKSIHDNCPNFFPVRDQTFDLQIPTGETLSAKLCQDNNKALMTNPNNALSDWLLRKILKLQEGELLTYTRLELLGIDSVKVKKINIKQYQISFMPIDSFESFVQKIKITNQPSK